MNRRTFLKAMGLGVAVPLRAGAIGHVLAAAPPGTFAPVIPAERDPVAHVISRLTFGVTPALYAHVQNIGIDSFIDEQLALDLLDDPSVDERLKPYRTILNTNAGQLFARYQNQRRPVVEALIGGTALHAIYSQQQLYERMVRFFSDHFNISIRKGPGLFLKIDDDRDVIRPHAMGSFRDLLGASAHSPAMLFYLDNFNSDKRAPNENYARELLELHTMGVNGGYTEADIKAVARSFTGWSISGLREDEDVQFRFRRFIHDGDEKTVLGTKLARFGGEQDGEIVLDLLAEHPATARFISTKLARRFVADNPPSSLIEACTQEFLKTDGDIRAVLRLIFKSDEFWSAPPKFKRPFEYVVSILRALDYNVERNRRFFELAAGALEVMGQMPFTWPAPDGFPDVQSAWTGNLLMRWNVAMGAAGGELPGAHAGSESLIGLMEANHVPLEPAPVIDFMAMYLWGRPMTEQEESIVVPFMDKLPASDEQRIQAGIGLLLASPAFQYR